MLSESHLQYWFFSLFIPFFSFKKLFILYWGITNQQCCGSFRWTVKELTIHNTCIHSQPVQFSSVAQSCPTLSDPMNRSTPGLPVHHQLPEFTQTHVHRVGDAIQPSHPLSSPSPPAPNPSQHQSLFQWVNSSHEVAKVLVSASASVLPMNIKDWFPLGWTGGSPCSPRDSQESSPIPQFKSINSSALSLLHSPTLTSIHDY